MRKPICKLTTKKVMTQILEQYCNVNSIQQCLLILIGAVINVSVYKDSRFMIHYET